MGTIYGLNAVVDPQRFIE